MNSKHNPAVRPELAQRAWRAGALAVAVASAAFAVTACGDASMSAKTASKDSLDAIRIARSAGEMRPKASFVEDLQSNPDKTKEDAVAAVKGDTLNTKGVWKQYFEQNSRADDLKTAVDELNKAADADVPPTLKSLVQSELGTTAQQYAQELLSQEQQKVLDLSRKWVALQDQASYVMALGGEAGVQDARAKVTATDTSAAQNAVNSAKENTAKAQAAVDDLQKQIADKQSRASQIYSQTEAAFQDSEKLAGNAAIDAARKAADQRKEADQLTADIVNLQLQLSDAQSALNVAQIQQKESEAKLAALESGVKSEQAQASGASGLAKSLREQAQKLVDAQEGLKQQYKDFSDLAGQIEKDAKAILTQSTTADKAYGEALTALGDAQSKLPANVDPDDPLTKVAQDNQAKALLMLQQAGAKAQTGQANLMAAAVASMRGSGETAMNQANSVVSGGSAAAPASAPAGGDEAYRAAAEKNFKDAESLITRATSTGAGSIPVKWLAPSLLAAVKYGEYDASHDPKDLQAGQDYARQAMNLNPYLRLNGLAGTTVAARENGSEPSGNGPAQSAPAAEGGQNTPPPPNTPTPPM